MAKGVSRSLVLALGVVIFSFYVSACFAGEEFFTITTYYPSPYGVYNELQLYPHDVPVTLCDAPEKRGTLFYNSTDNQIYTCKDTGWQPPGGIPAGAIIMWSGTIAAIPSGWQLCDGTNGSPDLRARFVRGAPAGQNPGGTGGEDFHNLTIAEMPAHKHTTSVTYCGAGIGQLGMLPRKECPTDVETSSSGGGQPFDNRPAYYEVAFIYKL